MADHMEDEEQVEALKRWWRENGRSTVVAVGLAIAGTVGWQEYQDWQLDAANNASDRYAELLVLREQATSEALLVETSEALKSAHSGSIYAAFAAMQVAADAVSRKDWDSAESQLRWVLEAKSSGERVAALAELRLARVMAAKGNESAALEILEAGNTTFPVAFAMARGDLHLVAGRDREALEAYREAEGAALLQGRVPALLETKIDGLSLRLSNDSTEDVTS